MLRIASVADVHLGNHRRFGGPAVVSLNQRCREGLSVLRRAVQQAVMLECAAFVIMGDLFDYQRPEAPLIAAVQDVFAEGKRGGLEIYVLVGNHDQISDLPGHHALAPLQGYAHIIEKPTKVPVFERARHGQAAELLLVPFRAGNAEDWLPHAINELAETGSTYPRLLGVHLGIKDDKTAPWLKESHDSISVGRLRELARIVGAQWALAGNWHDRRAWPGRAEQGEVSVLQIGALVPTGWDNPGEKGYGTLAVWDGAIKCIEIPGPRFLKMTFAETDALLSRAGCAPNEHYLSITAKQADWVGACTRLAALRQASIVQDGEVVLDKEEATRAAHEAASAATSARTFDEALAGFVDKMPPSTLPVDRAEVLRLSKHYLKVS
jgi:hypothetical protein